jgi:hypothetical protein
MPKILQKIIMKSLCKYWVPLGCCVGVLLATPCLGQTALNEPLSPQNRGKEPDYNTKSHVKISSMFDSSTVSAGISVGSGGLPTLDFSYKFHTSFAIHAEYAYLSYQFSVKHDVMTYKESGKTNTMVGIFDVNMRWSRVGLKLEYFPLLTGKWKDKIRLITGAAYFPTKTLQLGASVESFQFGDAVLNAEDIGTGSITLSFDRKISPYLGVGFGRLIPSKRWNLTVDAGAYYLGNWTVQSMDIKPGIILDDVRKNAPIVERNLNLDTRNKLLPSINLRLGFRLF